MFARMLEFVPKMEKKAELSKVVKNELLPILQSSSASSNSEHCSQGALRKTNDRQGEQLLNPYITSPILVKPYTQSRNASRKHSLHKPRKSPLAAGAGGLLQPSYFLEIPPEKKEGVRDWTFDILLSLKGEACAR